MIDIYIYIYSGIGLSCKIGGCEAAIRVQPANPGLPAFHPGHCGRVSASGRVASGNGWASARGR